MKREAMTEMRKDGRDQKQQVAKWECGKAAGAAAARKKVSDFKHLCQSGSEKVKVQGKESPRVCDQSSYDCRFVKKKKKTIRGRSQICIQQHFQATESKIDKNKLTTKVL